MSAAHVGVEVQRYSANKKRNNMLTCQKGRQRWKNEEVVEMAGLPATMRQRRSQSCVVAVWPSKPIEMLCDSPICGNACI